MPENYLLSFPFDWFKHLSHLGKKRGGGGNPIPFTEPLCQQFSNEILLQKV